jgi:hypothetical protein
VSRGIDKVKLVQPKLGLFAVFGEKRRICLIKPKKQGFVDVFFPSGVAPASSKIPAKYRTIKSGAKIFRYDDEKEELTEVLDLIRQAALKAKYTFMSVPTNES